MAKKQSKKGKIFQRILENCQALQYYLSLLCIFWQVRYFINKFGFFRGCSLAKSTITSFPCHHLIKYGFKSLPILFLSLLVTRKGKFIQSVAIKFPKDIFINVFETKNDDYFLPLPPPKEIQF